MKKINTPSGYQMETSVIHYKEINKFGAGVVIVNHQGMKTTRITTDPTMYNSEKEAEAASFHMGKAILSSHRSGEEVLYFDQHE